MPWVSEKIGEKVQAIAVTGLEMMELREFDKPRLGPKDPLMKIKYCDISSRSLVSIP